jgi:hypothetical protein
MSLSKNNYWYSNNCLHFLKCTFMEHMSIRPRIPDIYFKMDISLTLFVNWLKFFLNNYYNFTFHQYIIYLTGNHKFSLVFKHHRHLSIIDCLKAHVPPALFASLVLLMTTAKKKPWKTGASSGHITNLKQSILETFDIYAKYLQRHENSIYLNLTKPSSFLHVIFQK